jgi:hypothetical protein
MMRGYWCGVIQCAGAGVNHFICATGVDVVE